MKKIILIIVVLFFAGNLYITKKDSASITPLSYKGKEDVSKTANDSTETKIFTKIIAPTGFNTYLDNKYGFQFVYPNNLVVNEYLDKVKPGGFKSFVIFNLPGNNNVRMKYSAGFGEGMGVDPSLIECEKTSSTVRGIKIERHTLCNENSKLITVNYSTEVPFTLWFEVIGKENFSLENSLFDEVLETVKLP